MRDESNNQSNSNNTAMRKSTHKVGSATSANAKNKSDNSKIVSSLGQLKKQNTSVKDAPLQPSDTQQMQSTIKSGISGKEPKTVSNWNRSQKDNESEHNKMMATTGALSPRAAERIRLGKLDSDDNIGMHENTKNPQAMANQG